MTVRHLLLAGAAALAFASPAAAQVTVPISTTSGNIRLQPINKQLSAMLHINGPTHCRHGDRPVGCYLDNGSVLFEPF